MQPKYKGKTFYDLSPEELEELRAEDRKALCSATLAKMDARKEVSFLSYDKYFSTDKECRNIYALTITKGGNKESFRFGDSIHNTKNRAKALNPAEALKFTPSTLDILYCLMSDYSIANDYDIDGYAREFCEGLSFSETLKSWELLQANAKKLDALFSKEEIEVLQKGVQGY